MNIFTFITLLTALSIAGVAAWFSIIGLMYIFAASAMSIAIMAIVLEVGKLVTASWLYRYWSSSPLGLKLYLVPALIVLMFITSLGIFGYLSRAHIEGGVSVGDSVAAIERIEFQIATENKNIQRNENILTQLDAAIDEFIDRGFVTRGLEQREQQQSEREFVQNSINQSIEKINQLSSEKFELETKVRAFETEIGPIKYVAAIIYDTPEDHIDTAVRYIILLLIFVFDPLAVLLLIAANFSIMNDKLNRDEPGPVPDYESEDEPMPESETETETETEPEPEPESEDEPESEVEPLKMVIVADEETLSSISDTDHEAKFHKIEPSGSETPEHFVKRLVLEYGDPTEWVYADHKLMIGEDVIAHDISEIDAKNIITLAIQSIKKYKLQYHVKENQYTTI